MHENGRRVKLESLDIVGFKSFGERTHLDIETGITAVVGPNGCGKSNISDAISWVLGEQSVKNLRAKKIEDLIFNGSATRKSQGMAEVTVHMLSSNGEKKERYKICRRLYRSGESNFEINDKACRLRDIRELFIEMGVGVKSYSIIEQGKIDLILSSKASDRRILFEEAAGIAKFKMKRHQTLLKLEGVRQNLIRLNDIIQEVKRQLGSIKRQAGKARRYQRFSDELKKWTRISKLKAYHKIDANLSALQEEMKTKEDEKTRSYTAIALSESTLQEEQEKNLRLDSEIKALRDQVFEAKLALERQENRLKMLDENILNSKTGIEKNVSNIEDLDKEVGEGIENVKKIQKQLHDTRIRIGEKEKLLDQHEREKTEKEKEVEDSGCVVEDLRESCFVTANELTRLKNTIQNCTDELSRNQKQMEKLDREAEETLSQQKQIENDLDLYAERQAKAEETKQAYAEQLTLTIKERASMEEAVREKDEKLTGVKNRISSYTHKLETLENMQKSREGFEQGVKSVLFAGDTHPGFEINQVVLDILEAEEGLEKAIESTLKSELQFAIAETVDAARNGIQYLRETGQGFCSFLVKELVSKRANTISEKILETVKAEEGVLGPLKSFVKVKDNGEGIVSIFLNNFFICENFETACSLSGKYPEQVFITPDGDRVYGSCVFYGGAAHGEAEGFLALKRKKNLIRKDLQELDLTKKELSAQYEKARIELEEIREKEKKLSERIDENEKAILSLQHHIERIKEKRQFLVEKIEVIQLEKEQLGNEKVEVVTRESTHREEFQKKEAQRFSFEQDMAHSKELFQAKRESLDNLQEIITDLRLDLTKSNEQVHTLSEKIETLQSNQELALKKQTLLREEIATLESDIARMRLEKEKTSENLKEQFSDFDELKDTLRVKEDDFSEKREKIESLSKKLKELRKVDEAIGKELKTLEMKKVALETEMSDMKAQFLESFGSPIEAFSLEDADIALSEEDLNDRIGELKMKLDKMGNVNLVAFDEYQSLEKRYSFLMEQQKDIIDSRDSLQKVLKKLEKTSLDMFDQAFIQIRQNFKRYFTELFGEGKAELELTDEEGESELEKGIDIFIQPPGKRAKNILLLSGGEKALGALALLFAIFEYKATPFCVLDEADAPLDDINIDKFSRLLDVFKNRTQFILITHNKRTMKMASKMYGITMEEPGISKVLSVKFQ